MQFLPLPWERALSTPPDGDPVYPGGPVFNFLGVVESDSAVADFKEKEIRHGRLAMVGMLGLFAQVRTCTRKSRLHFMSVFPCEMCFKLHGLICRLPMWS